MAFSKQSLCWKLGLASALAISGMMTTSSNYVFAQIIVDSTLGDESSVVTIDTGNSNVDVISGGATRGANLFHSFEQFSILTGRTAFFKNATNIQNIISRVTGGSISNIDGIIRAKGSANLFLINPNGMIFGSNSSLDIGGSFVASTASSLRFNDGIEFSAVNPQASSLLSINVPNGLQFNSTTQKIVNQSQASPNEAVNSVELPVGLQVPNGQTLALVGGNVVLENGNLTVEGGRIELGSVAGTGLVSLNPIEKGYELGYADVENFQDIELSQEAYVDVSGEGGGDVQVQGRRVTIQDGSGIEASTLGSKQGGTLVVKASDVVELIGTTANGKFPSGLFAQVLKNATGNGGNIIIETGRLAIRDGASASTSTNLGSGRAGNLIVKASDSVELIGREPNNRSVSGLFAQINKQAKGNGGDLTIETGRLIVLGGAQISTATRTGGNGGTLTIKADYIKLSGISLIAPPQLASSGVFVSAEQGATGNAGKLNISAGQLIVEHGAKISADNFGTGQGGNVTLNVNQLTIRDGGKVGAGSLLGNRAVDNRRGVGGSLTVNATESVEVIGAREIASTPVKSSLFTQAQGTGNAGDLNIFTPNLTVRDGGEINVSATGLGEAGNLQVEADSIQLDRGTLTAATASGEGGNITLQVDDFLFLENNSLISARADGTANGGNIKIETPFIIAVPNENSDISANAFTGQGGRVTIDANSIFGMASRSREDLVRLLGTNDPTQLDPRRLPTNDITAISQTNPFLSGVVEINALDVDPSRKLVRLPNVPVNVEVAQGCQADGKQASVEFFNTGKGGLAPSPYEPLSSINIWEDVPPPTQETENSASEKNSSTSPDKIIEAQGWQIDEKGEITLVAEVAKTHNQSRCRLQ